MTNNELLKQIQKDHRQLTRYLYFFEKDQHGEFVPSDRLKFTAEQCNQPGVAGDLSLKDLLVLISGRERFFIEWYQHNKLGMEYDQFNQDLIPQDITQIDNFILVHKQGQSLEETLIDFDTAYQQLLEVVKQIPAGYLSPVDNQDQVGKISIVGLLQEMTWKSYRWAKRAIRQWSRRGIRFNKAQMLERIQTERRRLEKNLASLPEAALVEKGVLGDWSIKDILAHLVDWEQRFLGWYQAGLRGEIPQTPAPGLTWENLDQLNQDIYNRNRNRPLESIMAEFDSSYDQVMQTIRAIPEEEIFHPGVFAWTGNSNLATFILANTANHYRWAKTHIRKWGKSGNLLIP